MVKTPISTVIIAKNEEQNIAQCLESLKDWASDIIVVDDKSRDRTVEIAREYGARVFVRAMINEGEHRNWSYAQASCTWILSLDADEETTCELKKEIDQVLDGSFKNAYAIPRRNYFGKFWLKYGGQYPARQLKLFRKNFFRFEEVGVHPRVFVDGPTGELSGDIVHKSYRDVAHFIQKFNYQTTKEAEKWIKENVRMTRGRIARRSVDRFLRIYLRKKGFKDGVIGLFLAFFAAAYQIVSYTKFREMNQSLD